MMSPKPKVILVDDEEFMLSLLKEALEDSGLYEVDVFQDPSQAFKHAQDKTYDVAIFDVEMPKLKGEMLFSCLYTDPKNPLKFKGEKPALLLISGRLSVTELKKKLEGVNPSHYLQKPFEVAAFLNAVQICYQKKLSFEK